MQLFKKKEPRFSNQELENCKDFDFYNFRKNEIHEEPDELEKNLRLPSDSVKNWEQRMKAPVAVLARLCTKHRIDYRVMASYERSHPARFCMADAWKNNRQTKSALLRILKEQSVNLTDVTSQRYADLLESSILLAYRKPRLAILGCTDAGKSTLLNTLMSADKLPTGYQPSTSILVYIKHLEDRPAYIEDEVWIFRAPDETEESWTPDRLSDEAFTTARKLGGGEARLLQLYGTHNGTPEAELADCAILFVESEILKNCDLIDSPGICSGNYKEDKELADKANLLADIVVYASTVKGFMGTADQAFLSECIPSLPAFEKQGENPLGRLSNLFILATHAFDANYGNSPALTSIRQKAYENFCRMLPETGYLAQRTVLTGYEYPSDIILERMFPFATDRKDLHSAFFHELRETLMQISPVWGKNACEQVRQVFSDVRSSIQKELHTLEDLLVNREKYERAMEQFRQTTPAREAFREEQRRLINQKRSDLEKAVSDVLQTTYREIMDVDQIIHIINDHNYSNSSGDIQSLVGYLSGALKAPVEMEMARNVELYLAYCKSYLDELCGNFKALPGQLSNDAASFSSIDMDFGESIDPPFWMSTAYLIGLMTSMKTASAWGTSLLISVSPIIGIIMVAAGLFCHFKYKGWKKSAAKTIINKFVEQAFLAHMQEDICCKWKELGKLFTLADEEFNHISQMYTEKMEALINAYQPEQIRAEIEEIKKLDLAIAEMEHALPQEALV